MAVQILFRRGTATEWSSNNPILDAGEPGFEIDSKRFKIGDGVTAWNSLPFVTVTLADLADVANTAPSTGEILKWDGANWAPAAESANVDTTYQLSASSGTTGVNVTLTGSDSSVNDVVFEAGSNVTISSTAPNTVTISATGGGGGGLVSRTTAIVSTSIIADGASDDVTITGFKSYALLKIEVDAAAWVRIYTDSSARATDSIRLEGVDPAPGSGVIAEVITTGADSILVSPAAIGFNNESPVTTAIPITVTNKSGSAASITVTLTLLQLEA